VSFMLGAASYGVAIVASEGRVTTIALPKRVLGEDHRNVHRLRTGWVTGSVILPTIERIYDAIALLDAADVETIAARVRDCARRGAAALGDRAPAAVQELSWGRLFVVGAQPDGWCTIAGIRTSGETFGGSWVQLNVPPELWDDDGPGGRPVEPYLVAQRDFERAWWPWEPRPLLVRLRAIARFYQAVYELCGPAGSVNDRVELGIIWGEVRGDVWVPSYEYLPPTPAGELLALSDAALLARLQPSALETVDA
jgi:hypothetical protein